MELRQEVLARTATGEESHLPRVEPLLIADCLLLGKAIDEVEGYAP
jgi:hypothetical protein